VNKRLKKVVVIIGGIYLLIGALLYCFQEKMLFMPSELPEDYKFVFSNEFQELNIKNGDKVLLNAVHFKNENPKGVILYFHGNMGDLQRWGIHAEFFVEKEYDVLVMDYRTYGKSKGVLNEQSFYDDAQLFYNHLKKTYKESEIIVYGRSLGTGIATYVASKNNPKQLILETPYYSIADVAKQRFPIYPINLLLKYKFPSYKFIKSVQCPISIYHGSADKVVPYTSGQKLFSEAPKLLAKLITIDGGRHNNLVSYKTYLEEINKELN